MEAIINVTITGKVKTYKHLGTIGPTGGYLVGSHAGALTAFVLATTRYKIGVYLFGDKKKKK